MNISILGNGLTALSLAKNLTKKNINVRIYETKKTVNSSLNRTIGITKKNYLQIIDKFRNKKIWYKEKNKWKINNFLIKNWKW